MTKYFDIRDALEAMWDGKKVVNDRGDIYWYENGNYFKHPASDTRITHRVYKFYSDIMNESSIWHELTN